MSQIYFLVGTCTIFPLAPELIKENTYLHNYLNFSGIKKTTPLKDIVGTAFVLNEDPKLFKEFHKFLTGSDFKWNEEIMEFFGYMGYPNVMDYPLDFWKIKLRDNWIRNNFYKLELWNPQSTKIELGIERGPYVGLVDITPSLVTSERIDKLLFHIFTATLKDGRKELKVSSIFDRIADFSRGEIVLAGGSLISFLAGDPRLPEDLDFFITTKDEENATAHIDYLMKNYKIFRMRDRKLNVISGDYQKITRSENAITIGRSKLKLQVILRLYNCPSEVVHGFDLDASGVLYDGKKLWATERAAYALKNKINFFDFDRMSPTYGYRLAKYASRGFEVWLPDLDPELVRWDDLKNIVDGQFNYISEFRTGLFYNIPHDVPRRSELDVLTCKSTVQRIIEKRNPLDLILFASFFRYLPKLPLSDYKAHKKGEKKHRWIHRSFESDEKPCPRKPCARPESCSRRYPCEPCSEPHQYPREWWELAGPGYVIFKHDYALKNFITLDHILHLNKDVCDISGLSSTIVWKTQDPMTQLTGTFNPTTMRDIKQWYDDAYLYGQEVKLNFEDESIPRWEPLLNLEDELPLDDPFHLREHDDE